MMFDCTHHDHKMDPPVVARDIPEPKTLGSDYYSKSVYHPLEAVRIGPVKLDTARHWTLGCYLSEGWVACCVDQRPYPLRQHRRSCPVEHTLAWELHKMLV
jgi:hypothetical protein